METLQWEKFKDLIHESWHKALEKLSTPFIHYNFILKHPAYFSRLNQPFEHQKVFSKINTLLKQNNNFEMKWFDEDLPF